jgi:hypothetical protein
VFFFELMDREDWPGEAEKITGATQTLCQAELEGNRIWIHNREQRRL